MNNSRDNKYPNVYHRVHLSDVLDCEDRYTTVLASGTGFNATLRLMDCYPTELHTLLLM